MVRLVWRVSIKVFTRLAKCAGDACAAAFVFAPVFLYVSVRDSESFKVGLSVRQTLPGCQACVQQVYVCLPVFLYVPVVVIACSGFAPRHQGCGGRQLALCECHMTLWNVLRQRVPVSHTQTHTHTQNTAVLSTLCFSVAAIHVRACWRLTTGNTHAHTAPGARASLCVYVLQHFSPDGPMYVCVCVCVSVVFYALLTSLRTVPYNRAQRTPQPYAGTHQSCPLPRWSPLCLLWTM